MATKKLITVFIALSFIFACGFTDASQFADFAAGVYYHCKMPFNQDTEVTVDDGEFHKTDGQYMKDNILMVNAMELLTQLGFTERPDKKGRFHSNAFEYQFVENDSIVTKGGNGYQVGMRMEQAAAYKNGSLYIPLSFIMQMATDNTKTSYDAERNTVKLYTFNFSPGLPSIKTDRDTRIYLDGQLTCFDDVYTVTPKNYVQTFPQTLMVPICEVIPAVGGTATYDRANRTAVARNDIDTICFPVDTHRYFDFRGSADWSNYQPEIHNDHIYVPVTVINAFVDASKTVYDEKNNVIKFYSMKQSKEVVFSQKDSSSDDYKGRLWVSQKPFQPYPTEEQLFAEPSGIVEIRGIKADSYAKGQEVSWRTNNWEFYAAGHFEQEGIRVAEEVLEALKDKTDLIPGAVKGKLRVVQFGNPMLVTISWTYDGRTWYELYEEKGSPELMVKMLETAAKNHNPAPIPLQFAAAENNQAVRMEQKVQIREMMRGDMAYVDGINAYMYIKEDDSEDLHGGYGGKDGFYDLGTVGSILNSDNGLTCVRALQLYGKTLIKFQGIFGSHVLQTNYFAMEEGIPKPFLSVDGLTTEMDADGDGKKEIVAELSGTIPSVNIFKWDGRSLLVSSVDKALGADSVEFNPEDGSFRAYYKANARDNPDGMAYRYTGNGLELKKADRDAGDILSENVIDCDGDSVYEKVIVRMTEGKQYEETAAGPFMGWNWQGKFAVRLVNAEGKVLSEMGLNKIFYPDGADMIFSKTFLLQFNDYNNDGSPDFVMGQYGSSNGNLYRLFTIKNGKIEPLPVKNGGSGELFSSGGRSRYTREFDKFAKSGFINWYYNNALGKNIRQNFVWDGAQFVVKPGGD